jgi:prepilin-type N-terminal cleavage/methylation domain-containing protein
MTRPNNSILGFTLIEMLGVVTITAILAAIALPSFLNVTNRQFVGIVPQIESSLKIVSLKARANAGNPYKVTVQGKFLKVNYLLSNDCTAVATEQWRQDPTLTVELPAEVSITNFPVGGICFDGTGQATLSPGSPSGSSRSLNVVYSIGTKANSKAVKATINISSIGDISRRTYDANGVEIPNGKFN